VAGRPLAEARVAEGVVEEVEYWRPIRKTQTAPTTNTTSPESGAEMVRLVDTAVAGHAETAEIVDSATMFLL